MVTVLLFGQTLRDAVSESEIEVALQEPMTVKKLLESHPEQLGGLLPYLASREALIMINKKVGSEDSLVKDGDLVKLSFQSRTSYDGTRDIPT